MDQVHVIRHKVRMEGRSVRRVAREMRLSRNTVRRYLDHEVPIGVRRATARPAPVREVVEPRLEALLASTAAATGGKQRLTTTRLHGLLVGDGSRLGSRWSRSSWRSDGDERRRCSCRSCTSRATWARSTSSRYWSTWQASGARPLRAMHSGCDFAGSTRDKIRSVFLDGHVRAFAHFGGVPQRLLYDNLKRTRSSRSSAAGTRGASDDR